MNHSFPLLKTISYLLDYSDSFYIPNQLIMKYILMVFFFFTIGSYAQEQKKEIVVKGIINGDTKGYNKVYCYGEGVPKGLVQELKNGCFEFTIPFEKPIFPWLYLEYDVKIKKGYKPFGVLADKPGEVFIKLENINNGFDNSTITGLESAVLYKSFNDSKDSILVQIKELVKKQYKNDSNDSEIKVKKSTDSLTTILIRPVLFRLLQENKDSFLASFVLNENKKLLNFKDASDAFEAFSEEAKNSPLGISISSYITGAKNSQIGNFVNNFTLYTNENKAFEFSSLEGKYILLDFWASWCGPCRNSFPHMKELFLKYAGKDIAFVNISIDKNKNYWLNAVEEDNTPWTQLIDDKEIALKRFAVTSVPTRYLIDKDGKILMKEIGLKENGESEIENKLKTIFAY